MTQIASRTRRPIRGLVALVILLSAAGCHSAPASAAVSPAPPPPRSQNPSPMVERGRKHERIPAMTLPSGIAFRMDSILSKPVDVFIPDRTDLAAGKPDDRTLLVHFFGATYVTMNAVASNGGRYVLAVINLGAGSSAYEKPFTDSTAWWTLVQRVRDETRVRTGGRVRINRVIVSAFSAGYGGVRALLRDDRIAAAIDGMILLDGLHVSYVPERTVIAEGGALDSTNLIPFLRYARRAVAGETRMLITHSEIFPGTFASTTETTDWLIGALGLTRQPVLAWGPGGMQQISEARSGSLAIFGFAGNTGPDHIDHLHGLGMFLAKLEH